jgi:aminopeptidase N
VGLFRVPINVAITTSSGEKAFPIEVSKVEETFAFAVDGAPQMVLFDKGDKILKSVDFQKSPEEWIRQLRAAPDVPDRADAAAALGNVHDNEAVVKALGDAARHDKFWGVREEALRALGRLNSPPAKKDLLAAVSNEQPWVRTVAVEQLGKFHDDEEIAQRLEKIYKDDRAYSVRGAALQSLATDKAPNAEAILEQALTVSSPEDVLRSAALHAMGSLGDNAAVPALIEWSSPGKPSSLRGIAIASLGRADLKNHDITSRLIEYLKEASFDIKFAAVFALGHRGDPAAIEPMEALLKSGQLSIGVPHAVEDLIAQLKNKAQPQKGEAEGETKSGGSAASPTDNQAVLDRLDRLEHQLTDMNERLRRIEASLPGSKSD